MSSKEMLVLMAIVEVMFMDRGDFGEGEGFDPQILHIPRYLGT